MTLPWSKFFWSDYAGDPALKLCSLAAQGLWMRMLCIAAEHDPPGYVAVNGEPLPPEDMARASGASLVECEKLIFELERRGVFSRDRRGWIYSRRMIDEAKMRRKASEWGKKGGNPSLRKEKGKSEGDKGGSNGGVGEGLKPQKPEARDHSVDKSTGAKSAPENDPEGNDFDPVKALFDDGIRILGKAGISEKSARSLIGRWRKERRDDDAVALAIAMVESRNISQPLEWVPKFLASRSHGQPNGSGQRSGSFVDVVLEEHEHSKGARR